MKIHPDIIFTRQYAGLDRRIWLLFAVLIFVFTTLFAFTLKNTEICQPLHLRIIGAVTNAEKTHQPQEAIRFAADCNSTAEVEWDFGDKSQSETGAIVRHIYRTSGTYLVVVTVKGKCSTDTAIQITNPPPPPPRGIKGQEMVYLGDSAIFYSLSHALTYEWTVANEPLCEKQTTYAAGFHFNDTGKIILQLRLAGDSTLYTKQVQVLPKKNPKVPETRKSKTPVHKKVIKVLVHSGPPTPHLPRFKEFSPLNGDVGTAITIEGEIFLEIQDVRVGDVSQPFTNTSTKIIAHLQTPASGKITLVTSKKEKIISKQSFTFHSNPCPPPGPLPANEKFKGMFEKVAKRIDRSTDARDFANYLCAPAEDCIVKACEDKKKTRTMSLVEFCMLLRERRGIFLGRKDYDILAVSVIQNEKVTVRGKCTTNEPCVQKFVVYYR